MSDDWMIWAMVLQQQAQQQAAERARAEEAARQKAEADAAAAKQAQQAKINAQVAARQQDAQALAQQEADRAAATKNVAAPLNPVDSFAPVTGTGYGQNQIQTRGRAVENGADPFGAGNQTTQGFFQAPKDAPAQPKASALGDMFGYATQPQQQKPQQAAPTAGRQVGGNGGGNAGSFRMF